MEFPRHAGKTAGRRPETRLFDELQARAQQFGVSRLSARGKTGLHRQFSAPAQNAAKLWYNLRFSPILWIVFMAKAKDTAKEAPKARASKAKEKAAEKALLQGADGRNSGTA
jgi:hypothetical protein